MVEDKQGSSGGGGGFSQETVCCECIVLQSLYGSDELVAHLHTDVETSFAFKQMVLSTSRQFHFDQRPNGRNVLPWANNKDCFALCRAFLFITGVHSSASGAGRWPFLKWGFTMSIFQSRWFVHLPQVLVLRCCGVILQQLDVLTTCMCLLATASLKQFSAKKAAFCLR